MDINGRETDGTSCPKCGVDDRLLPRWFGVPRNLFIMNGRIRARGASGGSHRVYGWAVKRERFLTVFARSVRHIDRIICPHPWHELPAEKEPSKRQERQHLSNAEERRAKYLAKRRRWEKD